MLLKIGTKTPSDDVLDRILSCHERIRHHVDLAVRLSAARDVPPDEVADAARQVHRYFSKALPLHAQDEDASLAPRLHGISADVDAALEQMTREHAAHEAGIEALLRICGPLREQPHRLSDLAAELAAIALPLQHELESHLALEERVVFPFAREHLDPEAREALRRELDARHR